MSNHPGQTHSSPALETGSGYLEISEKGFGFLRSPENHFNPKPSDIFVTPDTIKKSFLREGCHVTGHLQPPHRGNSPQLRFVEAVNNMPFAEYTKAGIRAFGLGTSLYKPGMTAADVAERAKATIRAYDSAMQEPK